MRSHYRSMEGPLQFSQIKEGDFLFAGKRIVSAEEIVEFARRYDPQPFHIDAQWAANSRWKGLIASGWHTCSIAMALCVATILRGSSSIGSPGITDLRWPSPVRAGDELTLNIRVLEARISRSGGTGIIRWRWEMTNQTGHSVLDLTATSLFDLIDRRGRE